MKTTTKSRKNSKKKTNMRARMARFARVFWKKIKDAAKYVAAHAKKIGHKINSVGNFAPLPDDTSKPSAARRVARVVASIPKFVGMAAHYTLRVATALVGAALGITVVAVAVITQIVWGICEAIVMALSTPYYVSISPEYARENWKGFWNEFSLKEARESLSEIFNDFRYAVEDEEDLWAEATIEAPVIGVTVIDETKTEDFVFIDGVLQQREDEPVVQPPVVEPPVAEPPVKAVKGKGRPTPKRKTPRETYPFGPLADTA